MLQKIKTVSYKVRSHGRETTFAENGKIVMLGRNVGPFRNPNLKSEIKREIWHLQDVLKALKKLEREE